MTRRPPRLIATPHVIPAPVLRCAEVLAVVWLREAQRAYGWPVLNLLKGRESVIVLRRRRWRVLLEVDWLQIQDDRARTFLNLCVALHNDTLYRWPSWRWYDHPSGKRGTLPAMTPNMIPNTNTTQPAPKEIP